MRQCRSEGAPDADDAGPIVFRASGEALTVVDTVERQRQRVYTSRAVDPTPAPTDQFVHPVDTAVTLTTATIRFPRRLNPLIITDSGAREGVDRNSTLTLEDDDHLLEFEHLFKLYVSFSGRAFLDVSGDEARIDFPGEVEVSIGARSPHEHPAATITTTSDPVDMMAAVSAMSSALKTTSAERSFPTLRGHPPLIELGDQLDIPDSLETPDTDVVIEVPADYRSVFVVAPLAFYLGADLRPAPAPALVAGDTVHELGTGDAFEAAVVRTLKLVFTLDCVTRTEGLYPVPLDERDAIEETVDLDFGTLYDASLADRVNAYLDVPFEAIESHVPEWKQTTHISPDPARIELLPYLVDDLAIVKSPQTHSVGDATLKTDAVNEFMRNEAAFTRSASATTDSTVPTTVRPEHTSSVEQSWVGDGAPLGASKPVVSAFENELERETSEGPTKITVVCNEAEMATETDLVDQVYGNRDSLPFEITVHRNLSTDELEDVLATTADFFHFIGHVDGEGFKCRDGVLVGDSLDDVAVDAFFLNACQSYDTGLSLIERGAISGVATVRDVVNRGAERLGIAIARLLNAGFSLNAALDIARGESVMSNRYVVLGNGGFAVTQCETGEPNVSEIERTTDRFEVTFTTYPQNQMGMGTLVRPHFGQTDRYYLGSGKIETFSLSQPEVEELLASHDMPVVVDGELRWMDELSIDDI